MNSNILTGSLVILGLGTLARIMSSQQDEAIGLDRVPGIPYSEFIETVETGDLLFTSSSDVQSVTGPLTNCPWSHCGIAYKKDGRLFEWSAHSSTELMLNSNGEWGQDGAQLVPAEYLIASNGSMFWRRVLLSGWQRDEIGRVVETLAYNVRFSTLSEFMVYLKGPFSRMFDGFGGGMACSHIVAATYGAIKAMEIDRNISIYTPKTFSDMGDARWRVGVGPIKMIVGFDASRLIRIHKK